jgi:hypothetical protein
LKFVDGESAYLNKLNSDLNKIQPEPVTDEVGAGEEDQDAEIQPHLGSKKLHRL